MEEQVNEPSSIPLEAMEIQLLMEENEVEEQKQSDETFIYLEEGSLEEEIDSEVYICSLYTIKCI